MILEGLLTINGIDPYVEYGAFLSEEKQDGTENYSALIEAVCSQGAEGGFLP